MYCLSTVSYVVFRWKQHKPKPDDPDEAIQRLLVSTQLIAKAHILTAADNQKLKSENHRNTLKTPILS